MCVCVCVCMYVAVLHTCATRENTLAYIENHVTMSCATSQYKHYEEDAPFGHEAGHFAVRRYGFPDGSFTSCGS